MKKKKKGRSKIVPRSTGRGARQGEITLAAWKLKERRAKARGNNISCTNRGDERDGDGQEEAEEIEDGEERTSIAGRMPRRQKEMEEEEEERAGKS
jgi:hypothetical protein